MTTTLKESLLSLWEARRYLGLASCAGGGGVHLYTVAPRIGA